MRTINDAYSQFASLFGSERPTWDRDSLHEYLLAARPDWMHLDAEEFGALIDAAYDAALAELGEEVAVS